MTVLIIAEAGVNHNGDLNLAKQLIDAAKEAQADIVKFQSFKAEKLVITNAPKAEYQIENTGNEESQMDMLKKLELSYQDHLDLMDYCADKDIEFLSTPFDIDGLHMLTDDLTLKRIKLGSSELTNAPILLEAARKHLPLIISTGMANMADIENALKVIAFGFIEANELPKSETLNAALENEDAQKTMQELVTVLHCTTEYPTPFEDVNLNAMKTIAESFPVSVGYSDHTLGIEVSLAATAMGATVIEKHFTLDKTMEGPDHRASLDPAELKALVSGIRNIEAAQGSSIKEPAPSEQKNISMARKSLIAANDIAKGEIFTLDNLTTKRPGTGISPVEIWNILGMESPQSFKKDEIITLQAPYAEIKQ